MLFPIGDEQVKGGHKPVISYALIGLNILVFFWQMTDPTGGLYIKQFGSIPAEVSNGTGLYTLLTSMFMHAGLSHLAGNMLYLWIFADNIEATVGSRKFLLFYLIGGLFASYAHISLSPSSTIPCVGASGAIAAAMGAYLTLFPKSKIKVILLIFFRVFYIPAFAVLGIWIGLQLYSGIGGLEFLAGGEGKDSGGIAYWAHIGGFVIGVLAGFFFKRETNNDDGYFIEDPEAKANRGWEPLN